MTKKKNRRKERKKQKRIDADESVASIDVDESVASAIVAHVPEVKDRLALGCVSRACRLAAASPGCWQLHHNTLRIEPPLSTAHKFTDDAFRRLMLFAGNALTTIVLTGAPVTFKLASRNFSTCPLPNLNVLSITNCTGVSVKHAVLPFLRQNIQHHLTSISLSGCGLHSMNFRLLTELKSYLDNPDEIDLCQCQEPGCTDIIDLQESVQCMACANKFCHGCALENLEYACADCRGYVCSLDECPGEEYIMDHIFECEVCEQEYCDNCRYVFQCNGNDTNRGCLKCTCDECSDMHLCDVCGGAWCDKCNDDGGAVEICSGSGKYDPKNSLRKYSLGCGKSICEACNTDTTTGICNSFDWCDCCDGTWCKDCTPGTFCCSCCRISYCKDCMRYGCEGSPIKDYHCCGTCEVRWCDDCVETAAEGIISTRHMREGICICRSEGCDNISCGNCAKEDFICLFCKHKFCKKCIPGPGIPCEDCEKKVQEGYLSYEEDAVYDIRDMW